MLQPKQTIISPQEYFEMEAAGDCKSEYYHGEIFAMSDASHNHNVIAVNIMACLHGALRDADCFVYPGDMKVEIEKDEHYAYPDVSIVCGDVEFAENRNDIITNPVTIFEVLSKSTRDYDRDGKFRSYRGIGSLRDYILADQYSYTVEHFFKKETGEWVPDRFRNLNDSFKLRAVDVELALKDIYYRVKL